MCISLVINTLQYDARYKHNVKSDTNEILKLWTVVTVNTTLWGVIPYGLATTTMS